MTRPLVSVIIPNYNYAQFLKQRIESVLNQTYTDIEVIILDDFSTDDSKNVIEQYRNDSRVKHIIYNSTNSGSTFKQWQKGFSLANGEFIWIAEADDYADRFLLEKLIDIMADEKQIIVGFVNSYWVLPDRTFINEDYTIPENKRIYDGRSFVREHLLKENYIYNASMAVFRKEAIPNISNEYTKFRSCGDKLFWKSLAQQGKVLYVCEPLNYFRIHNAKVTTNSIANGLLFHEEKKFFYMNVKDGYINDDNLLDVVLYFLRYIENVKAGFLTRSTYINCKILWDKELHRTLFSNMCTKFQYSYWKLKAFLEDTVGKVKTKQ